MKSNTYFYNPIRDILAIKTNIKNFTFSYGLAMPLSDENTFQRAKIKITLNVVSGDVLPKEDEKLNIGKFHYFSGHRDGKEIFYERSFWFNNKLQYKISGLDTNHINIIVNNNYYYFVKHRFMNIHSIGYIITDIVNLRLLHNRLAPLHCSGVVSGNDGYVIFAPPNTGKTLTAMTLCMQDKSDYNFISEDLAITDGDNLFAAPWTSTFRYYDTVDTSKFSKMLNNLTEKISVLELFGFGKAEPITNYVNNISYAARIKGVYILDRGQDNIIDIDYKEAFDRINTLDRYEFNYMRAPAIIAYEYFNRATNIEKAYETERDLLKEMVFKSDFVKVVTTPNALKYAEIIDKDLKQN